LWGRLGVGLSDIVGVSRFRTDKYGLAYGGAT
jgi:hypothetical protein